MRECYYTHEISSGVSIEENKIVSFGRSDYEYASYRVLSDGYMGVHLQTGRQNEEECYRLAEENLSLKRPYKFSLETGRRYRDKTERKLSDSELIELAGETVEFLSEKYPDFTVSGSVSQSINICTAENSLGLDYKNTDCNADISISYKHKDSRELCDGSFCLGQRDYDIKKFFEIADNNLANYTKLYSLPEEVIIQTPYYGFTDCLISSLRGESLALGTSLLSGRIGEQVFNENFTFLHDLSDETCWQSVFWDAEGCTEPGDRRVYIDKGVVLQGYADKWSADKYGIPHTASSVCGGADIPCGGCTVTGRIKRSDKTAKQLLSGRLTVIPVQYSGGGFNDKGEYTMPVHNAFLCDGEHILGRLPPFIMTSNIYDMFGRNFIGVPADDPVFGDKHMLVRVNIIDR